MEPSVRFGSKAALQTNISRMSGLGGKADIVSDCQAIKSRPHERDRPVFLVAGGARFVSSQRGIPSSFRLSFFGQDFLLLDRPVRARSRYRPCRST